ncbi:MAG: glycosyltransferase family 25 protein [bacterium]
MPQTTWPIFVISLARDNDRRSQIARQLTDAGLDFRFIDAVDGRGGLAPEWESQIDRPGTLAKYGYGMSDGEYGCSLSHIIVYRKILAEGLPGAVVLEDDALLTPHFAEFYRKAAYLGCDLTQLFAYSVRIWRWPGRKVGVGDARSFRLAENPFSAVAYCLSHKAADYLLSSSLPVRSRADWPADLTLIGSRVTIPSLVRHPPPTASQSHIAEGRKDPRAAGVDFTAGYAKGWRRLITLSSWRRFFLKRFSRMAHLGY